jgi:hypothetical protein
MTSSSPTISSLLEQADQLARMRSWTRAFALGILYCAAEREGRRKNEAELIMALLQQELRNKRTDPLSV